MTINEAKNLLTGAVLPNHSHQQWTDLGCGSGTFSYALAELLPQGSNLLCVDLEKQNIKAQHKNTTLQFKQASIDEIEFAPQSLDGILMANSLHYIKSQEAFIKRLDTFLKPAASFLIVEYDTDVPNRWVPYPNSFNSLQKLFHNYGTIKKGNEKPSVYGRAMLYSCQITK